MALKIFRKKHVRTHADSDDSLHRCLTAWDLTLLGIGAIIGTGIFVLTGIAAATQAGPAVILSFVIAGTACAFAALSYAELSSAIGGCGSAYGYTYAAFGELFAFIIGWNLLLEYGIAVAAVANGWSGYFCHGLADLGFPLPEMFTKAPKLGGLINLPASMIILLLMALLIIGVKQSAKANNAMVFVKLITIAFFICVALFNVNPANWHPFMPFGWFETLPNGKTTGVLAGASLVFFAYVGFDAVSTAAEEAKNPQRDLPIGIITSLAFCTLVYILVAGLLTGVVPYTDLNVSSPVAHALSLLGFTWASALISTGVIAGLTTVMLVLYYGLTRIIFAMSRDGLLSAFFSKINPNTQTPIRVIVICGLIMSLIAGLMPLGDLAELVNIGTLSAFAFVCLGVIVLRVTHPDMPRPFRSPFSPLFPVLGMLSCSGLMVFLPALTWLRFIVWMIIGLIVYFTYSIHHSELSENQ
ncbi:amino acid transporter [Methyloglobulus morosus KoM1]|uniref:Amino acid transporter n=1 Tax=Methyloglobulus morosus KoM1 TaxID=1116472 RepID=V5BV30_9GAMM|nr:amino acid permease [Methyloglobulus morosus]ESS71729.1 amino acid transporter [Methyloglobulus morosus KoM1]